MRLVRLGLFLLIIVATAATSRRETLPEPDLCSGGATAGATGLELLIGLQVLGENDVVEPVQGGQGSDMLPLRYRVSGLASECLAVDLAVYRCDPLGRSCDDDGARSLEIARVRRSLRAYADGSDVATNPDFAILESFVPPGTKLLLEATVAGASTSMHINVTNEFVPDAGLAPDAAALDAGADANSADAGPDAAP